jgi:choline kinase
MKIQQSHVAPTRRNKVDRNDITVIIMAANIGYGMKSYGPKSLLNINPTETLIEYQLNMIQTSFPNADIILVVGFAADRLIKRCPPGVRIIENQLYETTNEVEQVRLALNCSLTDNVLIIKDDIIFNDDTFYAISKNQSCLIYDSKDQIDGGNIGVTVINGFATTFSYDMTNKWCHIVYLTEKDMKILRTICSKRDRARMYLHEGLDLMLQRVGKIQAIEPKSMEIVKIDTSKHLLQLQATQ